MTHFMLRSRLNKAVKASPGKPGLQADLTAYLPRSYPSRFDPAPQDRLWHLQGQLRNQMSLQRYPEDGLACFPPSGCISTGFLGEAVYDLADSLAFLVILR